MKALVLEAYHRFEYKDVPEPEVGPEDVLIAVKACGICGSDVHGMDGSTGRRRPPVIMGHEASGVIVACGDDVAGWQRGDRVTFDSTIYCGRCHFCRTGRANLCDDRRVLGVSCEDYRRHGAFADFVAVPQHILYRLPEDVVLCAGGDGRAGVRRIPRGESDPFGAERLRCCVWGGYDRVADDPGIALGGVWDDYGR